LHVYSAGPSFNGAGSLDITRRGIGGPPDPLGIVFAPTEAILRPVLRCREQAKELRRKAGDLYEVSIELDRIAHLAQADRLEADAWAEYVPAYLAEMRVSYGVPQSAWGTLERLAFDRGVKARRDAWDALLARQRVVLKCFCSLDPLPREQRCHRVILRSIILPKLGAKDMGEIQVSS
jgi:hypothetical protein